MDNAFTASDTFKPLGFSAPERGTQYEIGNWKELYANSEKIDISLIFNRFCHDNAPAAALKLERRLAETPDYDDNSPLIVIDTITLAEREMKKQEL